MSIDIICHYLLSCQLSVMSVHVNVSRTLLLFILKNIISVFISTITEAKLNKFKLSKESNGYTKSDRLLNKTLSSINELQKANSTLYEKKNMNSFCPRLSNTSSVAQSWRTRCWRRRRAVTTGRSPASRSRRLPLCRRPVANRGWTNGSATWTPLCAGLKRKSGSKCVYTIERVLGCREQSSS